MIPNVYTVGETIGPMEVLDLRIDGGAVARYNGKVVFLSSGVPGDIVKAAVVRDKKKIIEADVISLISLSVHRTTPWCPHFEQCGGCEWQHISLEYQLEWKRKHIHEALKRIGGVELTAPTVIPSPHTTRYRTKMSYAFAGDSNSLSIGLRRKKSSEVTPLTDCGLQQQNVSKVLEYFLAAAKTNNLPGWENREGYLRFLIVHTPRYTENGNQCLIEVITAPADESTHAITIDILNSLLEADLGVTGVILSERRSLADIAKGEKEVFSNGITELFEIYGTEVLSFSHTTFMQTNTGAAQILYELVKKHADLVLGDCLWDMYCGVGSIGIYAVGDQNISLCGVDFDSAAIEYAQKNSSAQFTPRFVAGDAGKAAGSFPKADVIILDPPRAGINDQLLHILKKSKARRIIYVSCDIGTQARDINNLSGTWKATAIFPVDMFPYTPHVENLVLLERKEKQVKKTSPEFFNHLE